MSLATRITALAQAVGLDIKAHQAAISAKLSDAPSDGKTYGRKDTTWVEVGAGGGVSGLVQRAVTSADGLTAADNGKLIVCSGSFTLAIAALSSLGSSWFCYVQNAGTGDVPLEPDGTETIDGITGFVLYPGAVRLVLCDGTVLRSIPLVGGTKTFTSTGSYTWAPGVQQWDCDLSAGGAGGGGGARAATRYNGGGGGAGERWKTSIALSEATVGASVTCTVGANGTGGAAATGDNLPVNSIPTSGTPGGASSIGTLRSVAGGIASQNGAYATGHGQGARGGGKGHGYAGASGNTFSPAGQTYNMAIAPTFVGMPTEWAGPSGRAGDDSGATGVKALLGGQRGGRSGAAVAAGTAGANGANPGDGGDGGAGNLNGSPAGKGGDGADGKITIVEVI